MQSDAYGQHEITLLQERNSGTFAQVYLARAKDAGGLKRIVAVKMLKERWTESDDVLNRTRDEAQLLASLQHHNIVRVDAITEISGCPAIIMEFVHGLDVAQLLNALSNRNEVIPPRAIYEIAECIASALAAAWFKAPIGLAEPLRVVHRDIKPSNVMIGVDGALKVLDFGTARFEDAGRTAKTEAIRFGSLKYMSPERRHGERGDHAADLYSLGLVILELLGGRIRQPLPVDTDAHQQALIRLVDAIPDFGLPNSGWDNSLRETLMRLCAVDPTQRLDARQTVKLMRAFKEQANGDGLIAFAEETVAPLTRALNAIPDLEAMRTDESHGQGQFMLHADGRTSVMSKEDFSPRLGRQPKPAPEPEGISEDLPTQLDVMTAPQSINQSVQEDEPTQTDRPRAPLQPDVTNPRSLRPGFALQDAETEEHDPSTDGNSGWTDNKTEPVPPAPATTGNPKRLPPPKQAQPTNKKQLIAIGCATAVVILIAMVGGSFALWQALTPEGTPTHDKPLATEPGTKAKTGDLNIELHAGDPTVQWVRLSNAGNERLLTARPDASAKLPAGSYTVSVKVMARSVLNGSLEITDDLSLTCKPATMGRVRCTDANGNAKLLLRP